MAINAYTGLQGSGKSFEVMRSVVLEAIFAGRNVVTNIDGINEERIHAHLVKKREADPDRLGHVIHVSNSQVKEPAFFPDEERPDLVSVVQPGDIVAIDEAWRFWGTDGGKFSHEHMQFFRMHRHYTHPDTGVACDVVLMTQDITGLHRNLRNVIEFSFLMTKLKSLGLTKMYRVQIYEGWKQNKKTQIDVHNKKYDAEIFPLYKSYAGGQGKENAIDKRANILTNKKLWLIALGVVGFIGFGIWNTWRFFHRTPVGSPAAAAKEASQPVSQAAPAQPAQPVQPTFSERWRVVGQFSANGQSWVVIANQQNRVRLESPSMFSNSGLSTIGVVDGARVTTWSAPPAVAQGALGLGTPR